MKIAPQGPQAARLRQRKFELLRRFPIPPDLLPGSLALTHRRCGQEVAIAPGTSRVTPSGRSLLWSTAGSGLSTSPTNGWRKFNAWWRRAGSLKRRWRRSSPATLNCWRCGESKGPGEGALSTSPQELRGEVSAPEVLLTIPGRRPHPGPHSGDPFGVSFIDGGLAASPGLRGP
jgi:hypothetical protein